MEFLRDKDRVILARLALWSTVLMLVIIPVQIAVLAIWTMPSDAAAWIELFASHPVVSLLHLDALYAFNVVLLCVIYLGLFALLAKEERAFALVALVLGLVGAAAYFPTVRAIEISRLSRLYSEAQSPVFKEGLRAAIEGMISVWKGTGYTAYYYLSAFSLLFFAIAMIRSAQFGRTISLLALMSALLMMIPATAGNVGMVFSLLSLIPWIAFLVFLVPKFRHRTAESSLPEEVQ